MSAERDTWTCTQHGIVPVSACYKSDIERNRRRCKQCCNSVKVKYDQAHPFVAEWLRFVKRVRRRLTLQSGETLSWKKQGKPWLEAALGDLTLVNWNKVRLQLTSGATTVSPDTIEIVNVP
jgi:predicted amidophosphoribosyltransferase